MRFSSIPQFPASACADWDASRGPARRATKRRGAERAPESLRAAGSAAAGSSGRSGRSNCRGRLFREALLARTPGNYSDGCIFLGFWRSPLRERVGRRIVSTLPYEVKLKTLFEWPDFGECVSVKVFPPVEQNENNFLENIETRAMIATLS